MYKKQEKELQNIVFGLINSNMTVFYGLFLTEVNKFFSTRIPTACLAKHPNAKIPVMLFNPDFWDKLNEKQRTFLVLHETHHLSDQAFLFCKEFALEKPLDNIALDLTINSRLMVNYQGELEFIEGGMLPANFPELQLEEEKDSLYYYNKLKEAKDKKEESKGKGEDSKAGEPGNGNGTSGDKNLDDLLDNQEKIDKHVTWEELTEGLSDLEKEVLKRDIMNRLDKISDEVAKQNGNIPKHLEGLLNKITKIKEVVNWKSLFRKFVGSTISSETLPNRKRPSRRFDENPGTKYKFKTSVVIGVDSSGSMGNEDINSINGEIHNMWKAGAKTDFFAWDCEAGDTQEYKGKLIFERVKAGGTDTLCAINHINKNYKKYGWEAAIIGTDGYVPNVIGKCKIPLLFVITKDGSTTFDNPYNYKIVKIN
jgi:predicted metal-dependent peptidase